jgi:CxxC motif-containing protein (DUF1111 family)/predicted lipoprotein with Yx(FWY)xxD motif
MLSLRKKFFSCLLVLSSTVLSVSANATNNWDMDHNGEADALTDGLLMLRYSFGMRGDSLVDGAIALNSPLSSTEVEAQVLASLSISDIDGDGQVDALTDGLLLLRYLFGLADDSLVSGAVSLSATRSTVSEISQYISDHMPGSNVVDSDNDGVSDDNDAFPNDPNETLDTDGDGVGNNADAFPNDPTETLDENNNGIGDNADANNANNNSGPQSLYCEAPIYHLNMEAEASTLINLTIENIGNDRLRVAITSGDSSPVDFLSVELAGATISDDTSVGSGELAKILAWSGSKPASVSLTILWSKTSSGGNSIVRDIVVETAATCGDSGSNSGGGNTGGDNGSGSNTSDPDGPAPTPDEDPSNVLSIFSDSYTDISGVNFNPAWGQSTTVTNADGVLSYQNLNYQGTTFGGPKNVSGYGYFHIDILAETAGTLKLFLINSGAVTGGGPIETYFDLNLSANQWNSFDIPLSSFSSVVDLTQVDELKIEGSGNITLDNLYFAGEGDTNGNDGDGNSGTGGNGGNEVIPSEEIAVANGVLVGGVNSANPQYVVYVFDNDPISGGTSSCYGGCADAWPPVLVTDESPSGVSGLGSITRTDDSVQVTYEGRPLYFYAGDQQPGDRSGDNVAGWHSIEYGNIGQVNKLYNDSTDLEPVTAFTKDNGVIVTRIADRGRDRHAKDSGVQDHYDHYLAHYWQYRTMRIQLEDYVPTGQSLIKVTWITEAALGAKEFRVWYAGQNTSGQFWFNPQPAGQQANPNEPGVHYHGSGTWNDDFEKTSNLGGQHKYTLDIINRWDLGGQIQETLQTGWNMEFEASMFLSNPPAGSRLNYYGTSFVYKIGQPGVHPFEWQLGTKDGTPIPTKGLSGGGTTLGYNYTNEPAGRFMQMATNMAPGNAESFVLGRRVHHTSFVNGVHGERHDNPVWTEQSGKSGTHYINESCAGCHVRNGRALVADVGGSLDKWVFKVGDANGNPMSSIGSVLQPTKIGGGSSEGSVTLGAWSIMDENDFDGDFVGLRKPNYQFSNVSPPKFSARIAPSLVGMGLLEAVDESTVISWEDENDSNNDGISGRASIVQDPTSGVMRLGRFGYKAATFSVEHQVASAFNTDMGVMTSMIPNPDCGSQQTNCGNTGSEIADEHVDNLVKYVSLLGVGARRNYNNTTGEALFDQIGCADCHRPSMVTSNHHPLSELRGQTIYPYTDLLLHDMGPGLADSLGEGTASGSEWRTAPLWGLGLTKNVMLGDLKGNDLVSIADAQNRTGNLNRIGYLHDGRAKTIDEAIRWHGGEAENSRRLYSGEQVGNQNGLTDSQRNSIVQFLESL